MTLHGPFHRFLENASWMFELPSTSNENINSLFLVFYNYI